MCDPNFTKLIRIESIPHENYDRTNSELKPGEQFNDMHVYTYKFPRDPEYWSLHYMTVTNIKDLIGKHLI
jgi:hypothetical protein